MTSFHRLVEIGPDHEPHIEKFLSERIGDGCWGIRVEHNILTLKVLPKWEALVQATLDAGNYIHETAPAVRKTGVSSIAVIGMKRPGRQHSKIYRRRLSVVRA